MSRHSHFRRLILIYQVTRDNYCCGRDRVGKYLVNIPPGRLAECPCKSLICGIAAVGLESQMQPVEGAPFLLPSGNVSSCDHARTGSPLFSDPHYRLFHWHMAIVIPSNFSEAL